MRLFRRPTSILLVPILLLTFGAAKCTRGQISDGIEDVGLSIQATREFLPANLQGKADELLAWNAKAKVFVDTADYTNAAAAIDSSVALFNSIVDGLTGLDPAKAVNIKRYLALGNIALHLIVRLVKKQLPANAAPQASAFEIQAPWDRAMIPPELLAKSKTKGKLE